jgi:hypothetical protein
MKGLNPIIEEIEEELKNLRFFSLEAVNKKQFLTASLIVLKAIIRLAERYAEEAIRMAAEETDAVCRKNLERIASACRLFLPIPLIIFIRPCSPYGSTRSSQHQAQHIISVGLTSICTPFIKKRGMRERSLMKRCWTFCVNCV